MAPNDNMSDQESMARHQHLAVSTVGVINSPLEELYIAGVKFDVWIIQPISSQVQPDKPVIPYVGQRRTILLSTSRIVIGLCKLLNITLRTGWHANVTHCA